MYLVQVEVTEKVWGRFLLQLCLFFSPLYWSCPWLHVSQASGL